MLHWNAQSAGIAIIAPLDPSEVDVLCATSLEVKSARAALRGTLRVVETGIALRRAPSASYRVAISAGLAGGLRRELATGSVVIPRRVGRPDGTMRECDPEIVDLLCAAAREVGLEPVTEPLLTCERLVHRNERAHWAERGYAAVDMESALIDAERLACVRVILDTPLREIDPLWQNPWQAAWTPRAWRDLPFLMREGPRCAALAARVVAGFSACVRGGG